MLFLVTPKIRLLRFPSAGKRKLKCVKIATSTMVVRLCAGHVRGENSPRYVMKELKDVV